MVDRVGGQDRGYFSHVLEEARHVGRGLRRSNRGLHERTYMVEATSMRRVRMRRARRRPARERPDWPAPIMTTE